MNKLRGTVEVIEKHGGLTRVCVRCGPSSMTVVTLELPEAIRINSSVDLLFKETEVSLADERQTNTIDNQIPVTVVHVDKGSVLTDVRLRLGGHQLGAIFLSESGDAICLDRGHELIALIRAQDISLGVPQC